MNITLRAISAAFGGLMLLCIGYVARSLPFSIFLIAYVGSFSMVMIGVDIPWFKKKKKTQK